MTDTPSTPQTDSTPAEAVALRTTADDLGLLGRAAHDYDVASKSSLRDQAKRALGHVREDLDRLTRRAPAAARARPEPPTDDVQVVDRIDLLRAVAQNALDQRDAAWKKIEALEARLAALESAAGGS